MTASSTHLSGTTQTIGTAVVASTLAAMPSLLLAGLAILVGAELNFGAFELGIAIGAFFAVSGLLSVPAALLSETIGPRRSMFVGALITVLALAGIGAATPSWGMLLVWMVVAGLGNTITQIASNHLLARQVDSGRQGIAYGIKQSGIPIASMLAGLALPLLGLSVGWRATFLLFALAVIPVAYFLRGLKKGPPMGRRGPRAGDAPLAVLAVLATGSGLGAMASSGLTTFTVVSAVDGGFSPGAAGLLLTAGSVIGISARILSGWMVDRRGRGSLILASSLLGAGVLGYLGLAIAGSSWLVVLATLVAFAGGWGWPGLILLVTARTNPRAPATAMAVTRVGPSVGNIIGPILFGATVDGAGYPVAWSFAAGTAFAALLFLLVARRQLVRHRDAAGPRHSQGGAPQSG